MMTGGGTGSDPAYERIRYLDGKSAELLLRFARERFGDDFFEEAWCDFLLADEAPFDPENAETEFFSRWMLFNWRPGGKATIAEQLLAEAPLDLDDELRSFVDMVVRTPYSFYQTLEVTPGHGIQFRDVLRKVEVRVSEKKGSRGLERGQILYGRIMEYGGLSFIVGNGKFPLPPLFLDPILRVRDALTQQARPRGSSITTELLRKREDELRDLYFLLLEEARDTTLKLRTAEGDPWVWHTLSYRIPSFEEAFEGLKDLEMRSAGVTEAELLERVERDRSGRPVRATIHLFKPRKRDAGPGLSNLATLRIGQTTLIAEVNSARRSARIKKEIAKRLGGKAVLEHEEILSLEEMEKKAEKEARRKPHPEESYHDRLVRESPEARALIKKLTDDHWARWPDMPIPALRGMTPRQAARDEVGRELLEALLMEFDSRDKRRKDQSQRVDTEKLRRELGLTGKP